MIEQVTPQGFDDWLARAGSRGAPLVLDVRETWEVQLASPRADGYELLSMPMGQIQARLAELDPARPVACLCHHGARSMRVAQFLAHSGFTDVVNLAGGIEAWSQQKDPSVPRY